MRSRLPVILVLAVLLASCGDDSGVPTTMTEVAPPTTVAPTATTTSQTSTTTTEATPTTTEAPTTTASTVPGAGLVWARVPDNGGGSGGLWSVVSGGPGLVAVGSGGIEVSEDGYAWTVIDDEAAFGGPGVGVRAVTAGGPGLVAVGRRG
jgi:hypothetical protein